ncbi:FtsW/RodA/SpoVE family cell cycle protein [Tannockella kyphosi]|uniref:FtsW/RodA/SpoVE family cell cycle protein n=1 Tax=Tannockella kyphosi TaxID=2899121 RepID=UPI00201392BC|nr:FtsW/RodA/SpoVE family cell cycle protein [Tannockella kyphosi]
MFKSHFNLISKPLFLAIIALMIISCIAIASATPLIYYNNPEGYWIKQAVFYLISFVVITVVYNYKNDRIYSSINVIYGILMVLLALLVVEHYAINYFDISIIPFAKNTNGATSWYEFPGFDIQPSEFMKIAIILMLAKVTKEHNHRYDTHCFSTDIILLGRVLLVSFPPCLLIYLGNDTGVVLIIFASVIFLLFASGMQSRWFLFGAILIACILGIATYLFIYNHDLFVSILGGDHKISRIYGWLDPEGTYGNEGYQLFNALLSYGGSGLLGYGFQSAIMSFPEAQTDFIFAVIAQGFGLVGAFVTIFAIVAFDVVVIVIGLRSYHEEDKYFIAGLMGMLLFQQIWNIGMVLGIVPITGITLPFISYGGSSLISYMIAIGLLFDIERQTRIQNRKKRY